MIPKSSFSFPLAATGTVIFASFSLWPSFVKAEIDTSSGQPTLKDQYAIEKSTPVRNAQACQDLINRFNNQSLDRFTANGSRVLGLDLHGKIFEVKRSRNGVCTIANIAKLEVPYQDKNEADQVEEVIFYYEPVILCAYRYAVDVGAGAQNKVRRLCYQPLGVVNKYAPYKSP